VDGRVVSSDVVQRICWFFTHIFTGDLNFFKDLTARRLYKSFGVKGLREIFLHVTPCSVDMLGRLREISYLKLSNKYRL
jgi:hypothetical protein